jgi:hypothetical protein
MAVFLGEQFQKLVMTLAEDIPTEVKFPLPSNPAAIAVPLERGCPARRRREEAQRIRALL